MSKILIVDDETATVDLLSHYLGKNGYEIISAFSATEALIRVETSQPDLMVLDIMMPEHDGFFVLERLRDAPHVKNLPVIVISARADSASINRAMELGASAYISKPFRLDRLLAAISEFVSAK